MRNCDQEIYNRGEMNHNVAVSSSISSFLNTKNLPGLSLHLPYQHFTAFVPFVNGFLPLSSVPESALHNNLREVVLQDSEAGSRLTLATPIGNLMTYYETKLLRQKVPSGFGLNFTLAVPISSQATVLPLYHAIKIPMPDKDNAKAAVWAIETDYSAVLLQDQ